MRQSRSFLFQNFSGAGASLFKSLINIYKYNQTSFIQHPVQTNKNEGGSKNTDLSVVYDGLLGLAFMVLNIYCTMVFEQPAAQTDEGEVFEAGRAVEGDSLLCRGTHPFLA